MGLFSGMEKFGLGKYNGAHVVEEEKHDADENAKAAKPKLTEEDCLFDKHLHVRFAIIHFPQGLSGQESLSFQARIRI